MRRLLLDRLFVCLQEGAYLTQPHGRFGAWRRVTGDQKDRLIDLYLLAVEGTLLLVAFEIYRGFFGDSNGFEDLFSASGFTFGVTIFMAQAWLLTDAPEVSAHARKYAAMTDVHTAAPAAPPSDFAQAAIVLVAAFAGMCVLAAGLMLREGTLSIAGASGIGVSVLLLRREMLRLWRSRR